MVHEGSIPLYWRMKKAKYNLIGSKCISCGKLFYPQRSFCIECRRKGKTEDFRFSGRGEIESFTVIRVPPNGFEKYAPYTVAIIKLVEGVKTTGQICAPPEAVKTGQKVQPVFRKIYEDGSGGIIHYGLKFELVN